MINTKRKNSRKGRRVNLLCVCFQSYENGMLLCIRCKSYLQSECYKVFNISIDHICGPCAGKEGVPGTSSTITEFIFKPCKSVQDHSMFAFEKMLWRVMNSILKGDFRSTQPGTEPVVDFFKICKQSTSSSGTKGVH